MAFLRAARPAGREWTVEEAAVYAARRDYELLKLLADDKKALRTARILGMQIGGQQRQQQPMQAAANEAVKPVQSATGSAEVARKQRKRRPPNEARRQKQRERAQQKRLKLKLMEVLPIVHKWAKRQHEADTERMSTSPPASPLYSPPYSSCSSDVDTSDGSAAQLTQQRSHPCSYAAAVVQPAASTIAATHQQHGAARSEAAAAQLDGLRDAHAEKRARMRLLAQEYRVSRTLP